MAFPPDPRPPKARGARKGNTIAVWKAKLEESGRHPIYVASEDARAFVAVAEAAYALMHEPLRADEPIDIGQVRLLEALARLECASNSEERP